MLNVSQQERDESLTPRELAQRQDSATTPPLIGDYVFEKETFKDIDRLFEAFDLDGLSRLNELQRIEQINKTLLQLIIEAPEESFLLPAVIDYIERVIQEGILDGQYSFSMFEQWLNHFSELTPAENYRIRAKIVGRYIPREEYQVFFPIGMGRVHPGPHFVTAHYPPDLDTVVSSFWGWVDAFGARVGRGLHIWNLPGGEPAAGIMQPLLHFCGKALFSVVPRHGTSLAVSALDLVTQKKRLKQPSEVVVDQKGAEKYVTTGSSFEEIRTTINQSPYVTVVRPTKEGHLLPLGVIDAVDLHKKVLGTVTLRDFCNRDEVKIASHLEIISVIDHHRTSLQTSSFPTALIGDVQSCNVLVAEQTFLLNDRYGLSGMSPESIEKQLSEALTSLSISANTRILQRLLQRRNVVALKGEYYVHPKREIAEYLCFLYAIFDDTDLLERVTSRDVVVVASLVNRLKTLIVGKESEIITYDDIPRDENFATAVAKRILSHPDVYSLYKKIYTHREGEVEQDLQLCLEGRPSNIFVDTKEQKGCARVGQTKLFVNNRSLFSKNIMRFRERWSARAQEAYQKSPQQDLHIQMITTIAGADEVYRGSAQTYAHQDELWLWIPDTPEGHNRLAAFLSAFKHAPEWTQCHPTAELIGSDAGKLSEILKEHFLPISCAGNKNAQSGLKMAVLRFDVGTITSRKTSITPYIPSLS